MFIFLGQMLAHEVNLGRSEKWKRYCHMQTRAHVQHVRRHGCRNTGIFFLAQRSHPGSCVDVLVKSSQPMCTAHESHCVWLCLVVFGWLGWLRGAKLDECSHR